ncbi:CBO0543 family protein [Paenibacillus sp. YN15]|uniref:CBO0543 family protein n=1 Tax=Paenibacillus sp. YN15 TaxID=1742774 RepID=UPI000DCB971F|nr:CBO0543 family protein [Paenibacillus sp. YN15]RAU99537.1 hypothetical protein DQG13_15695 [Paenibacillus sp. YN15]
MRLDRWILLGVWVLSFLLLFLIPRNKRRLALIAYLFKQFITSLLGLVTVELGLLEYPVRELADVNRTSFTYEYMAYPVVCALFNVFYPTKAKRLSKMLYYAAFCTALTLPEIFLERYTELVCYLHWHWWITWLTLLMTFFATRSFCVLFFKGINRYAKQPKSP